MDPDSPYIDAERVREVWDAPAGLTDTEISAFILVAHRLVYARLSDKGLAVDNLTEVERYLAAHFAQLKYRPADTESISGEYSATYSGKTGMFLNATLHGQMAVMLDVSGTLAGLAESSGKHFILGVD